MPIQPLNQTARPSASSEQSTGPSPLVIAQMRAASAKKNPSPAVLQTMVGRYMREGGAGVDPLARAASLMTGLLGRPFSEDTLRNTAATAVRIRLGGYAPIFDALQLHLQNAPPTSYSTSNPLAQPVAASAQTIAQAALALRPPNAVGRRPLGPSGNPPVLQADLVPSPPQRQIDAETVFTLGGRLCQRAETTSELVMFACRDIGDFSAEAWERVVPQLALMVPMLRTPQLTETLVSNLLTFTQQCPDVQVKVVADILNNSSADPQLVRAVADSIPRRWASNDVLKSLKFCITGFADFKHEAQRNQAIAVALQSKLWERGDEGDVIDLAKLAFATAALPSHDARVRALDAFLKSPLVFWKDSQTVRRMISLLQGMHPRLYLDMLEILSSLALDLATLPNIIKALQQVQADLRVDVGDALLRGKIADLMQSPFLSEITLGLSFLSPSEQIQFVRALPWLSRATGASKGAILELFSTYLAHEASERAVLLARFERVMASETDVEDGSRVFAMMSAHTLQVNNVFVTLAGIPGHQKAAIRLASAAPQSQQWHIADSLLRLNSRNSRLVPPDAVIPLMAIPTVYEREIVVTHLLELEIPVDRASAFEEVATLLAEAPAARRIALGTAYKNLCTPAIPEFSQPYVLQALGDIATDLLESFVFACTQTNPRPSLLDIQAMHDRFIGGFRPSIDAVNDAQNVHTTDVTQRVTSSATALVAMYPRTAGLAAYLQDIKNCIDQCERGTPADRITRQIEAGHVRTRFNEARQALLGPYDGAGYRPFATTQETYTIDGGENVPVQEIASRVWEAIEAYPRNAVMPTRDPAVIAAAKTEMKTSFVMKFADCIENDKIICYMGKTSRAMQPLQGFIRGIVIDEIRESVVAQVVDVPPGQVLANIAGEEFGDNDEPSEAQIEKFIGRSMARAEIHWPGPSRVKRDEFVKNLSDYVEMTFEEYTAPAHFYDPD